MDARELRIGNYYQAKSPEKEKYEPKYMLCGFSIQQAVNNEINLKPIELTSEWFNKLGFQLYGHLYTLNIGNGLNLTYNTSLKNWFVSINSISTALTYHFNYVHEIQDFYFVLTRKHIVLTDKEPIKQI